MPELRWILIAFGFALLVGIYVWGRRNAKANASAAAEDALLRQQRPEPVFEAAPAYDYEPSVDLSDDTLDGSEAVSDAEVEAAPEPVTTRSHVRASVQE